MINPTSNLANNGTKTAKPGTSRRRFLQTTAVAAGGFWIAGRQTWAQEAQSRSPNERLNVACIGVGGKGDSDTEHVAKLANLVAICDIDDLILGRKSDKHPKARRFNDYRQMFDEMSKEIDCVVVSGPDHVHAVQVMRSLREGKHVYAQKPLTQTVWEARLLRETARKQKVATQMGNQGTANNRFRAGVDLLRAGALGEVKEVHLWTNRPVWPQSPEIRERPEASEPPAHVHWDLWLGPAPYRPYTAAKGKNNKPFYHDFNWRGWRDFGTGALGDMGCHTANLPYMGLGLGHPRTIWGESEEVNPETFPAWARVKYEFANQGGAPVAVNWYEGRKDGTLVHPPEELVAKVLAEYEKAKPDAKRNKDGRITLAASGSIIVGEKGMMYSPSDYGIEWYVLPADDFRDYKVSSPTTMPRLPQDNDEGHKAEWLIAARGGPAAKSNFDYGGMLTEFILLGNVAISHPGKTLEWDGPNLKFPNAPEAEKFLRRPYRSGWEI